MYVALSKRKEKKCFFFFNKNKYIYIRSVLGLQEGAVLPDKVKCAH